VIESDFDNKGEVNFMKKMLAALLMFSMIFVLAACGSDSESSGEGDKGYVGTCC